MSVQATLQQQLTILEELSVGVPDVSSTGAQVRHDQFNVGPTTLNASSTPPAAQCASLQLTGTQTIDLTALSGTNGATVNGNGQKVQAVLIQNPSTNTGDLTIAPAGVNPYPLQGTGNSFTIPKGGSILKYFGGNAPVIGAAAKGITFTPAAGGDKYNIVLLLG